MDIGQFVKDYGLYILEAIAVIIGFISIFCKKRPKTLDDFVDCLHQCQTLLPIIISEVEKPGNGLLKKKEAIFRSKCNAKRILGRDLTDNEEKIFVSTISESIEDILSTPKKKGF